GECRPDADAILLAAAGAGMDLPAGPPRVRSLPRPPRPGPGPDPPGPQRRTAPALGELSVAARRGDHLDAGKRRRENQPGPERHGRRVPAAPRARTAQRRPALNARIWHNRAAGAPAKRPLIARDHVRPAHTSRSTI
ncbi:MAG: hypothetical protein ACRDOE_18335, partial [Streptosporangiaceae bacterium]